MSTGGELQFDAPAWAAAGGQNGPAPAITPAQIATVGSAIDQLLAALGIASNTGIPGDNLDAQTGQAERAAGIADAQTNFPASDQQSAQLLQSLPQLLAGAAGAFGGALTGALQPFAQLAQQGAQAAQQGLQAGLGAVQQADTADLTDTAELPEELGDATAGWDEGGPGGAGEPGGFGDTAPASLLGPPPTPSAATYPASAPTTSPPTPSSPSPAAASRTPMGAVPYLPPGAMPGGPTGNEPKPDTKRIIGPTVRDGAPVQGRISAPPPAPVVTKHVQGKPVATRRILLSEQDDPEP